MPHIGPDAPPDQRHRCGHCDEGNLCGEPAVMHVLAHDRSGELCILATCLSHYHAAVASGRFVGAHEFAGWCGLPGTRWHVARNMCLLDDSGDMPERAVAAAASSGARL